MILDAIYLSMIFILSLTTITLMGILVSHRTKNVKLIFLDIVLLLKLLLSIYFSIFHSLRVIFTKIDFFINLPFVIVVFLVLYPLRKKLDKNLIAYVALFASIFIATNIIFIFYYHEILGIVNIISLSLSYILIYFTLIKYLIKIK